METKTKFKLYVVNRPSTKQVFADQNEAEKSDPEYAPKFWQRKFHIAAEIEHTERQIRSRAENLLSDTQRMLKQFEALGTVTSTSSCTGIHTSNVDDLNRAITRYTALQEMWAMMYGPVAVYEMPRAIEAQASEVEQQTTRLKRLRGEREAASREASEALLQGKAAHKKALRELDAATNRVNDATKAVAEAQKFLSHLQNVQATCNDIVELEK